MKSHNRNKGNMKLTAILIFLLCFFVGTIIYITKNVSKDKMDKQPLDSTILDESNDEVIPAVKQYLCVIKRIDTQKKAILLYNETDDDTIELSYTDETSFTDQYSKALSVEQLSEGELVYITFDEETQTMICLNRSMDTWEYTGVTNLNVDRVNQWIKLYGEKYKFTSKLYIRNTEGETTLFTINKDDVLTIRGHERTIDSIVVTKGHGSIALINADYFAGGSITIGTKDYYDITPDMVFTVREGDTKIVVEKDDTKVETTVKILRNEEISLDLSIYTPNPDQKGEVTFVILPFGAELFIDDALTSYANAIELTYGEHVIEVTLEGYETYSGSYTLDSPSDIVQIILPETSKEEENEEEENTTNKYETGSGTNNSTQTGSGSNSATPQSGTSSSNNGESTNSKDETQDTSDDKDTSKQEKDENHHIYIQGPVGASLYINGEYQGIVPIKIEKPIGITYITLMKSGYEQITHTIRIEDDEEDKYYTFPALVLEDKKE